MRSLLPQRLLVAVRRLGHDEVEVGVGEGGLTSGHFWFVSVFVAGGDVPSGKRDNHQQQLPPR